MTQREARIEDYRKKLEHANNESVKKELLKDLLRDLFRHDEGAVRVLDSMTMGAERAVLNIPLADRTKRGREDTQYGKTIIEFENDLGKMGEHAKEQLAEYLLGNWRSGETYRFTLITTDSRDWRIYAPSYEQVADGVSTPSDLDLREVDRFVLDEKNGDAFYFFLDRWLFGTEPLRPTLEAIEQDFGVASQVFLTSLGVLGKHFEEMREDSSVQVAFEQWSRFLSIAYGEFEEREDAFLVHTYLSVFSKILAYEVLTGDEWIDEAEMRGVLTGDIFDRLNVRGFIDRDFFAWVAEDRHLKALRPMLREIARVVGRYDFSQVGEDILKGVYQDLIDLDTRHALGEYYTPDWLCQRVVQEFDVTRETRFLDPACGSGSFLRAVVARLREEFPDMGPNEVAERVAGIDIHPLSVQIAKTTLLLALGKDVRTARRPVNLRVYLANTLRTPEGAVSLFGGSFVVSVNGEQHRLTTRILGDPVLFDAGVAAAEELAEATRGGEDADPETLGAVIGRRTGGRPDEELQGDFYKLYGAIKRSKEMGRDGIWKFIVQNLYKPYFLREQFDVIVGNPPWLA